MGNLATTYSALGKYNEALALQLEVLEFNRRVLPEDHRQISEGDATLVLRCFVCLAIMTPVFF